MDDPFVIYSRTILNWIKFSNGVKGATSWATTTDGGQEEEEAQKKNNHLTYKHTRYIIYKTLEGTYYY